MAMHALGERAAHATSPFASPRFPAPVEHGVAPTSTLTAPGTERKSLLVSAHFPAVPSSSAVERYSEMRAFGSFFA